MAVYYKHIKGCASGVSDLNNLTYIQWQEKDNPKIIVGSTDKGTVLTSNYSAQIMQPWTFSKEVSLVELYGVGGEAIKANGFNVSGECVAASFNATSDIRAKTNIKPATYSALDLINKLSVFNYNYINMPNSRETGIIAQELLEKQPEELDLVVNPNASGENGDFMSIKTDKLVMVLLKAIQEQQEEINHLKEEINKLK